MTSDVSKKMIEILIKRHEEILKEAERIRPMILEHRELTSELNHLNKIIQIHDNA